jgi:hypothetical protein
MNEMRAAQYDAYGPPEALRVRNVPVPRLRPGHVLVRAAATSINGTQGPGAVSRSRRAAARRTGLAGPGQGGVVRRLPLRRAAARAPSRWSPGPARRSARR